MKYNGKEVVLATGPDPGYCYGCAFYDDISLATVGCPEWCGDNIYVYKEDNNVPDISE